MFQEIKGRNEYAFNPLIPFSMGFSKSGGTTKRALLCASTTGSWQDEKWCNEEKTNCKGGVGVRL